VLILSKSFKNKTGMTLIFFISDGIGQYIIKKYERSQVLLNPLYIKTGKDISLSKTYQDTPNVYDLLLKLLDNLIHPPLMKSRVENNTGKHLNTT
jgi:hypothetical protein